MASHRTTMRRTAAIKSITDDPALSLDLDRDAMEEWVLEICMKWEVARRTALEYIDIARMMRKSFISQAAKKDPEAPEQSP